MSEDESEPTKVVETLVKWGGWGVALVLGVYGFTDFVLPVWKAIPDDKKFRVAMSFVGLLVLAGLLVFRFWDTIKGYRKDAKAHRSFRDRKKWPASRIVVARFLSDESPLVILKPDKTDIEFFVGLRNCSPFTIYPRSLRLVWRVTDPGPNGAPTVWEDEKVVTHGFRPIPPGEPFEFRISIDEKPCEGPGPSRVLVRSGGSLTFDVEDRQMSDDVPVSTLVWGDCRDDRPVQVAAPTAPPLEATMTIDGTNSVGVAAIRTWTVTLSWREIFSLLLADLFSPQWELLVRNNLAGRLFGRAVPDKQAFDRHAAISDDVFHTIRAHALAHNLVTTAYQVSGSTSGTVWQATPGGTDLHVRDMVGRSSAPKS